MGAPDASGTSGKVLHGSPSKHLQPSSMYQSADGAKPVSSIPAKFETILYTGPREKKGFLSEGPRFGDTSTDIPGPGTYGQTPSLVFQKDSIGKKGYGAMVSEVKRFKKGTLYTGPGPGVYNSRPPSSSIKFSKKCANFQKPAFVGSAKPENKPGPGAYHAESTTHTGRQLAWEKASNAGSRAAFKATPHSLILSGCKESPPPTKYNAIDPWAAGSSFNTASSRTPSKAGMSSFAGRSVSSSLGPADPAMYLMDPKEKPKQDTGPGPGSYDMQSFGSIERKLAKVTGKPSATFQASEFTDRFGAPVASALPGGDSIVPDGAQTRSAHARHISGPAKGVGAAFQSETPSRSEYTAKDLEGRAPGPAFYSPDKMPARKSFHMNARNNMV
uniref:Uncharacterized protein n=1 Tax=Chlamydomonas euryale TaxID=1486919 RepID=A0A7R9W1N2_9CHLO|mmetsp:Transcript_971/g.2600  ORF Transcript_971/g.2600 Transcript_971/m.2600 type:complete len:387 (+) Transcript_971:73-1233(+)